MPTRISPSTRTWSSQFVKVELLVKRISIVLVEETYLYRRVLQRRDRFITVALPIPVCPVKYSLSLSPSGSEGNVAINLVRYQRTINNFTFYRRWLYVPQVDPYIWLLYYNLVKSNKFRQMLMMKIWNMKLTFRNQSSRIAHFCRRRVVAERRASYHQRHEGYVSPSTAHLLRTKRKFDSTLSHKQW